MGQHRAVLVVSGTLINGKVFVLHESLVNAASFYVKCCVFMRPLSYVYYRFGPVKERDGTWRIKTNEELERLIDNKNIINYIKGQRLARSGHVNRMPDNSMVKKI